MRYKLVEVIKSVVRDQVMTDETHMKEFFEHLFKHRCRFSIKLKESIFPRTFYEQVQIMGVKDSSVELYAPIEGNCMFEVEFCDIIEIEYRSKDRSKIYEIAQDIDRYQFLEIVDDDEI